MGKLLGRRKVRSNLAACYSSRSLYLAALFHAGTAVTDVVVAEALLPKLLPLQPCHQLLLTHNTPQPKQAGRLRLTRPADAKTLAT